MLIYKHWPKHLLAAKTLVIASHHDLFWLAQKHVNIMHGGLPIFGNASAVAAATYVNRPPDGVAPYYEHRPVVLDVLPNDKTLHEADPRA